MILKNMEEFRYLYLAPLKGRFVWNLNSISWYLREYLKFKKVIMDNHNIIDLKPYLMKHWHLGWRYFLAKNKENKEYFIKYGTELEQIRIEICALKRMKEIKSSHVPEIVAYGVKEEYGYIIQERINGKALRKENLNKNSNLVDKLIEEFNEISYELKNAGVIHRDIRPENLMFCEERMKVILIDFAACVIKTEEGFMTALEDEKTLRGLGGNFKESPFLWDDVYAFCEIIKQMNDKLDKSASWKKLESQKGKFVYLHESRSSYENK